jgi:hypothetical protein
MLARMPERIGFALFATPLVNQLYAKLQRENKGSLGNHALIQALEDLAGFVARDTRGSI